MPISMDSTVMFNAACRVLFMYLDGSMVWQTGDREAYDLHGHQVDGKPILIAQNKLRLTMIAYLQWKWPCLYLQTVLVPSTCQAVKPQAWQQHDDGMHVVGAYLNKMKPIIILYVGKGMFFDALYDSLELCSCVGIV